VSNRGDTKAQLVQPANCDCAYPCSCVNFRGRRYGSRDEVIAALASSPPTAHRAEQSTEVAEEAVEVGWAYVEAHAEGPWSRRTFAAAVLAAAPAIRKHERQRVRELAEQLQGWARTKRREAQEFFGPEKLKAEWIAKGYDNSADLLLNALDTLEAS